jgi:hypothetical protein
MEFTQKATRRLQKRFGRRPTGDEISDEAGRLFKKRKRREIKDGRRQKRAKVAEGN